MNELRQRQPRVEDPAYLDFVRQQPCLICAWPWVEAAHIRAASPRHGKRDTGKAEKPSDCWAVPLCSHHHREQHAHGDELAWWASYGIDPLDRAIELYASRPGADKPKRERRRERKTKPRKPKSERRPIKQRGFGEQHRPMRGRNLKQEKH